MTSDCVRGATLTITGKGRKRRHIPLNPTCLEILKRHSDLTHFRVSRSVFYHQAAKYAKKAKIPCCGPHSFRHYFATQLLLKGVPIKKVSILLGHKSVQTTEKTYAHILPADLQGATDCLIWYSATLINLRKSYLFGLSRFIRFLCPPWAIPRS